MKEIGQSLANYYGKYRGLADETSGMRFGCDETRDFEGSENGRCAASRHDARHGHDVPLGNERNSSRIFHLTFLC